MHRLCHCQRLALAPQPIGALLGIGLGAIGQGRLLPGGVKPLAAVLAFFRPERGVDLPIIAADEFADFFFPLDHHRQRGGLHPTDGGQKKAAVT